MYITWYYNMYTYLTQVHISKINDYSIQHVLLTLHLSTPTSWQSGCSAITGAVSGLPVSPSTHQHLPVEP